MADLGLLGGVDPAEDTVDQVVRLQRAGYERGRQQLEREPLRDSEYEERARRCNPLAATAGTLPLWACPSGDGVNHPEWLPPAGEGHTPLPTRSLILNANKVIDPEQTRLGFRLIVAALMCLPDPADVSFDYEAESSDSIRFSIRFDCMTESAADHTASTAATIVRAIAPWLDVVVSARQAPPAAGDMASVRFALGTEETLHASATASFLWTAVSQGRAPVRFSIALQRLILPQAEDEGARIRAEATLSAKHDDIDALAALAGVDAAHKAALRVITHDEPSLEGELLTDIPTIARLLAGPFTVPALSQRIRSLSVVELGDLVAGALPPHVLWIGGSGQGKSTTMDNSLGEAARRGATVVVVCPHGDLAKRAVSTLLRHGVEPIVYDFGADDRHLRWNVTRPDPGVRANEWARRFGEVIRNQLWDDMPPDYFGPVMIRSLPIIVEALASDPAGPWPLTRVPDLLDPFDSGFRDGVLKRIGKPALTRALNAEVMAMIKQKDPGNASIWLISKFDPLIGDPTVRRIIDTDESDVTMQPALEGRSIVVSLPQSVLTEGGSVTLAALLLERLWAGARARRDPTRPIELFVDEWQKLPSPAIPQMLAEGRKFGIRLRLANQHLAQLTEAQREAVLANTGLIGTFRTSNSDANTLDRRFPTVLMSTMQTLPKHTLAYTTGEADGVVRVPPPAAMDEADFDRLAAQRLHAPEPLRVYDELDDDEYLVIDEDATARRGIAATAQITRPFGRAAD